MPSQTNEISLAHKFIHVKFDFLDFFIINHPVIPAGIREKSTKDSGPVDGVVVIGGAENMGKPLLGVWVATTFFSIQN